MVEQLVRLTVAHLVEKMAASLEKRTGATMVERLAGRRAHCWVVPTAA